MHAGKNLGKFSSAAEFDAYAAIAGEPTGASQDQVAEAREVALALAETRDAVRQVCAAFFPQVANDR